MKTCRACDKPLERKETETTSNFKKREFCNRTCLAHYKHGTVHKLKPKRKLEYTGTVPKRFTGAVGVLMRRAIDEHPELPGIILEEIERVYGTAAHHVDTRLGEVSWG